jgi:hypothetical protein
MGPLDSNAVGLALIALGLGAYGFRIASRDRPERRRWGQIAAIVIVALFVFLIGLFVAIWVLPDPQIY